MEKANKLQAQAIMNLLYLGQDEQKSQFVYKLAQYQSKALRETRHQFKTNTIHIKNTKNKYNKSEAIPPIRVSSQQSRCQLSKNKQNLKKILQKLQKSPSPTHKILKKKQRVTFNTIKTQKSQQVSKQKSFYQEKKTPKISKDQFDRLFDKKNDKLFITSLIKAKIVQKLKKTDHKKSQTKAFNLVNYTDTMVDPSLKRFQKQQVITLRSEQRLEKRKYNNLSRQQSFISTSLFSRKNSQINLKTLLF